MNKKLKTLSFVFAVFAFAGFLDSLYLTFKHYQGTPLVCAILEGCNEVTASSYSEFLGMPVSLFGVIYYVAAIFLMAFFLETGKARILKLIFTLSLLALLASFYFLYLQIFVIEALCIYCLFSIFTSTMLFIFIGLMLKTAFYGNIHSKQ